MTPKRPRGVPANATWRPGDKLWESGVVRNGKATGVWRWFTAGGRLSTLVTYRNGLRWGRYESYYGDGSPKARGTYRNFSLGAGQHEEFAPPGGRKAWRSYVGMLPTSVHRVVSTFSNGKCRNPRFFDADGNECGRRGAPLDGALARLKRKARAKSSRAKLLKLVR